MYYTDEQMDEMGAAIDNEHCDHDWDIDAGQGQTQPNGAMELFDVCVKCGAERANGRWDSVL